MLTYFLGLPGGGGGGAPAGIGILGRVCKGWGTYIYIYMCVCVCVPSAQFWAAGKRLRRYANQTFSCAEGLVSLAPLGVSMPQTAPKVATACKVHLGEDRGPRPQLPGMACEWIRIALGPSGQKARRGPPFRRICFERYGSVRQAGWSSDGA